MSRREMLTLRHNRLRKKVIGTIERPRLSIYKSLTYIYTQIIDDTKGTTLVSATTNESSFKSSFSKGSLKNIEAAKKLGEILAERAKLKNIDCVVFDRGGFHFHGVIKEFADAARKGGIKF
jgi:large subunit ribosomal protein L18